MPAARVYGITACGGGKRDGTRSVLPLAGADPLTTQSNTAGGGDPGVVHVLGSKRTPATPPLRRWTASAALSGPAATRVVFKLTTTIVVLHAPSPLHEIYETIRHRRPCGGVCSGAAAPRRGGGQPPARRTAADCAWAESSLGGCRRRPPQTPLSLPWPPPPSPSVRRQQSTRRRPGSRCYPRRASSAGARPPPPRPASQSPAPPWSTWCTAVALVWRPVPLLLSCCCCRGRPWRSPSLGSFNPPPLSRSLPLSWRLSLPARACRCGQRRRRRRHLRPPFWAAPAQWGGGQPCRSAAARRVTAWPPWGGRP